MASLRTTAEHQLWSLEELLTCLSSGDKSALAPALSALSNAILFLPVIAVESVNDSRRTNRIRAASFFSNSLSVVPVFTSEDYFLQWSDGQYQCLSVAGGDIALTLPADSGIIVNPGTPLTVELGPEEVSRLAEVEEDIRPVAEKEVETDLSSSSIELEGSELDDSQLSNNAQQDPWDILFQTPHSESVLDSEHEFSASAQGEFLGVETVDDDSEIFEVDQGFFDLDGLRRELSLLLQSFPEIDEAYFEDASAGQSCAVLGILLGRIDPERRFSLIDSVAEIARRHFGAAGAIEVYDDLDKRTSSSWELFHALVPFYTRNSSELEPSNTLAIEKIRTNIRPSSAKTPWGRLREGGTRLLGALSGGNDSNDNN